MFLFGVRSCRRKRSPQVVHTQATGCSLEVEVGRIRAEEVHSLVAAQSHEAEADSHKAAGHIQVEVARSHAAEVARNLEAAVRSHAAEADNLAVDNCAVGRSRHRLVEADRSLAVFYHDSHQAAA